MTSDTSQFTDKKYIVLDFTIYRLTLREIAVVLAGEESISVSSHYAFDIPFTLEVSLEILAMLYYTYPPLTLKKRPSMLATATVVDF